MSIEFPDKVPVIAGDKCYMCSLQPVTVKGGRQVLYLAGDGTIIKREPLHRYTEREKRRKIDRSGKREPDRAEQTPGCGSTANGQTSAAGENAQSGISTPQNNGSLLLMCKDTPVYNITCDKILDEKLLPGAMARKKMSYSEWMRTRYSADSNVSAKKLMQNAFGTDDHEKTLDATRALSLSDCYWLRRESENVLFSDVTPYINSAWQGTGAYKSGALPALFAGGSADKRWLDADTLLKVNSFKEFEVYVLCSRLGLEKFAAKADTSAEGLLVRNFTTTGCFLESFEQSGYAGKAEDARNMAVEMFKERAVSLFVLDYLCEHDGRHPGNFGFLRDANTGEYLSMAPYYDFNRAWSGSVTPLPGHALSGFARHIRSLCERAASAAGGLRYADTVITRTGQLLEML